MNTVKTTAVFVLAFGVALGAGGLGQAQQTGSGGSESAAGSVRAVAVTSATASVEAVDEKNRVVTLKGPEGKMFSVPVGEDVENFDRIEPGDTVDVDYVQSVAVSARKAEGERTITETDTAKRVEAGELPGGVALRQVRIVTDVLGVDEDSQSVLVRGPLGHLTEVAVRDPKVLDSLEDGDQIDLTYVEGVAISMRAAGERG